ncbi:DMT family transporter [Pannonibacter sp. Q-1]|uniref:DMT family transporter n=1 Tax=Pannonibacter TaxID=227873 RepID=UPI000F03BD41|nr:MULTISPECIES: DMT family transporter [Pannonibacter]MBA4203470.1 EamA family transporter [Polymorphum sp.]
MIQPLSRLLRSAYDRPVLMLMLATLAWGGNSVAGKMAIGEVSPMVIVFLRWAIVGSIVLVTMRKGITAHWPQMRPYFLHLTLMALFGFVGFNMLFYIAAHSTSAVNLGIIQGAMPALVLIGAVIAFGTRVVALQVAGIFVTMTGVALVAAKGDLSNLAALEINMGDGIMLIACVFYAGYTLALRNRPLVPGAIFFGVMALISAAASVPPVIYEVMAGNALWPTPKGWLIVLFIAIFPSFLSQIFFMRGVELIGPARAGIFINLVPIFGAILAVLILSEPFHLYHALALGLVFTGIWLSERRKAPEAASASGEG